MAPIALPGRCACRGWQRPVLVQHDPVPGTFVTNAMVSIDGGMTA
jgi:hypothetical protein